MSAVWVRSVQYGSDQLGDQIVRFDREQTRKAYAAIKSGDAERCECAYFGNRERSLSSGFLTYPERVGYRPGALARNMNTTWAAGADLEEGSAEGPASGASLPFSQDYLLYDADAID